MLQFLLIPLLPIALATIDVTQQELKPIKGVPVSRYSLYQPAGVQRDSFKCLDGSRVILYSQVNDDYCDCVDGSDEPGTSACSNSHFFCSNVGHKGNFIPSSRVNDKLCDCCDGSDEYNTEVQCPNICDELGRAARVEKERSSNIARKGFAIRQELSKEGNLLKENRLKDVEPLKAERAQLQPQLEHFEKVKREAEDLERKLQDEHRNRWNAELEQKNKIRSAELFQEIDINQDLKINLEEVKLLKYIDSDQDGEVSDDEAKAYLDVDEADYEHFHEKMFTRLRTEKKHFDNEKKLSDEIANDDELLAEEDKHSDDEHLEEDEDKMPPYSEECQASSNAAVAARKEYDDVNSKVQEIDAQIREAEDFSSADYGADMSWAPMKGKCFERNVQQYTYVFCPFGQNTQKDTGGYGGTSLGSFKNWSGPENKRYSKQHYGDGQQCWNGPKRSTDISFECGEEHELVEVTEPAKCEYYFVFRTPLACEDPDAEPVHDEF